MTTQILKTTIDILCDKMLELRQFPFVDSALADADDQIVLNLIEEYQAGHEAAGSEMLTHAQNVIGHVRRAGYEQEDEVFLAEVWLDEAIAAERAALRESNRKER